MMRLSVKNIGTALLIYYIIFWLTITYYFTSQGQTSKTSSARSRHSHSLPTLTLTAHLYINGTHLPKAFPNAEKLKTDNNDESATISSFPVIDDYPEGDPYLPWIHDIIPSKDRSRVIILAQNRRRCHTGKDHGHIMKQLEPQIALFQPISLTSSDNNDNEKEDGSHEPTSMKISSVKDAIINETRFLCRFKRFEARGEHLVLAQEETTYSLYPYNYEYITWRKGMIEMFETTGKSMTQFWLSSLEFHCPVPSSFASYSHGGGRSQIYLDIATIRSPVRGRGEWFFKEMGDEIFDVYEKWGHDLKVKGVQESTRWENIFIPFLNSPAQIEAPGKDGNHEKPYQLVACTWSSATHNRRGDAATLTDGKERLREWIAFNLLVGFDHVVVYDNSYANSKVDTLQEVTDQFGKEQVTYVNWPCKICNNNRPAHDDPGERSSQYAAEASCRSRFGPLTDWMTFLDPDEYLVPMGKHQSWKDILAEIDIKEKRKVLKFRSTRARPRLNLMESTFDASYQNCPTREEVALKKPGISSCLVPQKNVSFLRTYNCEYIKSPKPDRFQRAMKQLYRPDFVLNHFVHYSTVTTELAMRKEDVIGHYRRDTTTNPLHERFSDELNEGVLIHAKTMLPNEGVNRNARCVYKKTMCGIGIECPSDLPFSDATHKDGFVDENGAYCNCWVNTKAENEWIPKLESALIKNSNYEKWKKTN